MENQAAKLWVVLVPSPGLSKAHLEGAVLGKW